MASPLAVTIKPLPGPRAIVVTARSISSGSRTPIALNSTPSEGPTAWIAANWPTPSGEAGSRRTTARITPGDSSLSSSSNFAPTPYSNCVKPVALPPGRAKLSTKPAPTGSGTCKYDRQGASSLLHRHHGRPASGKDDVRRERNQLCRLLANVGGIGRGPADIELYVAADAPACFLQSLLKCPHASLILSIIRNGGHEYADAPHALALLRARRERPRCRCAAEQRDELAPPHSITSSARASSVGGTVRTSIRAVRLRR